MQALDVTRRPAPRPVQARSHRTRTKILEATTEVLSEVGYSGTKTPLIAERAGVSQGALYRHFPTKLDLLEATLGSILAAARESFAEAFAADPTASSDPAGAVFRNLWVVFTSPPLQGAFDLYQAARTDPALAERVAPLIADHRSRAVAGLLSLFPNAAREHEDLESAVFALMSTMQGAAVFSALVPSTNALVETQRRAIERLVRNELGGSSA